MFPPEMLIAAQALLDDLRAAKLTIATAESCTGGLMAGLLTEIAGSSDVLERGFVTYSNAAKAEMLGVDPALIANVGAVSSEVAIAMADGALAHSRAAVSVAITGVTGPDGGTPAKPVGTVHIASARRGGTVRHRACRFGQLGRLQIRLAALDAALILTRETAGLG